MSEIGYQVDRKYRITATDGNNLWENSEFPNLLPNPAEVKSNEG